MSLPKIKHPLYDVDIPQLTGALKHVEKFRPFLVSEEKILLMARESGEPKDVLGAVKQVVENCAVSEKFDVNKLSIFALEYVFLKLRAYSVDSIVKLTFRDNEDEREREFIVDLMKIKVEYPKDSDNTIMLTPNTGITLQYPPASLYGDETFLKAAPDDVLFELIGSCIVTVFEDDEIYAWAQYDKKEQNAFLNDLDIKSFEKIKTFLVNVPRMKHVIEYKNDRGSDRKIELSTLNDFFTLL